MPFILLSAAIVLVAMYQNAVLQQHSARTALIFISSSGLQTPHPHPPTPHHLHVYHCFYSDADPRPRISNTSCTVVQTRNGGRDNTGEHGRNLMAPRIGLMSVTLYTVFHKRYQKDFGLVSKQQAAIEHTSKRGSIN